MGDNHDKSMSLAREMKNNRQEPIIKSAWGQFWAQIIIYAATFAIYHFWMSGYEDSVYKRNIVLALIFFPPISVLILMFRLRKERRGSKQ